MSRKSFYDSEEYRARLRSAKHGDPVTNFWAKVDKKGPDECWNWTGTKCHEGYGRAWDGKRMVKAPRFSWELVNGPIPYGLCALHHCDNSTCVNPKHIYTGTLRQNARDCLNRERRPNIKLGPDKVREIRRRVAELGDTQETYELLAPDYGVSDQAIYFVAKGRTWKWVV